MRKRFVPAIVIAAATLLVVALGLATTGDAARDAVLPRASVGTLQLKHNAVTASKLAPNAVRTGHLANGAVTAAKLRAGTLGPEHFRNNSLPQGPRGLQGPQGQRGAVGERGPKGDIGPSDAFVTRGTVINLTTTSATVATLTLPEGKYVIHTHVQLNNPSTTQAAAVQCGVSGAGSIGETVTMDPRGGGAQLTQHNMLWWADLPTGGTVTLSCAVFSGLTGYPATTATAAIPSIAAVKVGTLTQS